MLCRCGLGSEVDTLRQGGSGGAAARCPCPEAALEVRCIRHRPLPQVPRAQPGQGGQISLFQDEAGQDPQQGWTTRDRNGLADQRDGRYPHRVDQATRRVGGQADRESQPGCDYSKRCRSHRVSPGKRWRVCEGRLGCCRRCSHGGNRRPNQGRTRTYGTSVCLAQSPRGHAVCPPADFRQRGTLRRGRSNCFRSGIRW